jgi:hypothetical protein
MKTNPNSEQSVINVRFYLDSEGKGWYCVADVADDDDYRGQGCTQEDEWIYDRMFGG